MYRGVLGVVTRSPSYALLLQDGINFDRASMIRVRRTIDAATASLSGTPGLFDLHAGIGGPQDSPPALEYLSHLPFMDGGARCQCR